MADGFRSFISHFFFLIVVRQQVQNKIPNGYTHIKTFLKKKKHTINVCAKIFFVEFKTT